MTRSTALPLLVSLALGAAALAGCGSKPAAAGAPGSTTPDAASAATGDIPDNQVFLTYADVAGGYSIRYPEGWTRRGSGATVAFVDKDNAIHVTIRPGAPPSAAAVRTALPRPAPVQTIALPHGRALKAHYTLIGAPDAVTGKRPLLLVDRYVYAHGGRVATVDLATPKGVDNVDAYRMISRSFAWR
jgi:hypothetical protein